jgi:hypothetical protein
VTRKLSVSLCVFVRHFTTSKILRPSKTKAGFVHVFIWFPNRSSKLVPFRQYSNSVCLVYCFLRRIVNICFNFDFILLSLILSTPMVMYQQNFSFRNFRIIYVYFGTVLNQVLCYINRR